MDSDYSMSSNLIPSLFILIIKLSQISSASPSQAGSQVLLTWPHSLNTSLISETTKSSRIIVTFATQALESATSPKHLSSF